MHMSFYWNSDLGVFFFDGLKVNGALALTGLCVVFAILAIVFESMKVHDAKARARVARERQRSASCAPSETANLLAVDLSPPKPPLPKRVLKVTAEGLMFLSHNILGYALMLSVMMYNGYLFVAVVIGMGLGYFIFGHISMKINMENVQARTTNVICTPKCIETESTASTASMEGIAGPSSFNQSPAAIPQATAQTTTVASVYQNERL